MRLRSGNLLAVVLLAACALPGQQRESQAVRQPVRIQPAIDKSKTVALEPQSVPADFGTSAFRRVLALVAMGPRHFGRPGWSKQLTYIEKELRKVGLVVTRDTWTDRKERITFSNVAATIPGKSEQRILLACHHDTKCTTGHKDKSHNFHFVGANDGASAVALLLELAPLLQKRENAATIELVFFDGEESLDWEWGTGERALFGSRRYVKRYREARRRDKVSPIAAVVLLDMVGRKHLHIQEELYSTERLRRLCWSAAVATGHDKHFYQRAEAASDDHEPFLEWGIPAVNLIDLNGNPTWHTPMDTVANMDADSIRKVADVVMTMLPAVEQAYVATSGDRK